ncbi:MAG: N-acetyl-gamma-glutamyl-phosphate reductase, partial [Parvularcula sp.]
MKRWKVGLVGARGYVGRELLRLMAKDPRLELSFATSRQFEGHRVGEIFPDAPYDIKFVRTDPAQLATADVDVVVLGLPNGFAAPFVDAIDAAHPDTKIIDLSADYRHQKGWVLGLADLCPENIAGQRRIANPGCYATAAILALYPIRERIVGTSSIVGISGYSGAGTTRSEKNDPRHIKDNIIPYAFSGHGHQEEIHRATGVPVRFLPHVAPFFRGLMTTICAPIAPGVSTRDVVAAYRTAYRDRLAVKVQDAPPQISDVASRPIAVIGGASVDTQSRTLAVTCALDNLLKGAASQAM